jgi:hypothetical protein
MTLAAQTVVDLTAAAVRTVVALSSSTHTDRAWPFDEAELPAARVLAGPEDFEPGTIHGLELHQLTVEVELRVSAAADLDDAMHDLTAAVLTAVHGTAAVSARRSAGVQSFDTRSIARRMEPAGQAKAGAVDIEFLARFYTQASAPETIVN